MTKSVSTERYEEFRQLLIDARVKANLSQRDVAARLHRPQSFVSKYEQGLRRLDIVEFFELAPVLEIDPFEFLYRLFPEDAKRPK